MVVLGVNLLVFLFLQNAEHALTLHSSHHLLLKFVLVIVAIIKAIRQDIDHTSRKLNSQRKKIGILSQIRYNKTRIKKEMRDAKCHLTAFLLI